MKKSVITILTAFAALSAAYAQEKVISPQSINPMPKITVEKWERLSNQYGDDSEELRRYGDVTIYDDLYSGKCSWYCGGAVKSVTASSCLSPNNKFDYKGENAHDFNHESVWATKGKGIGESLTYTFEGKCPRITTVNILNGHVKSDKAWQANSRVKKLRVWYNNQPYAILALEDSRTLQSFDVGILGYNDGAKPDWTLKFEILEVYPGSKYGDTVIAELYFDGIDVH
ncbi:MAG: hypothetical protein IKR05_16985 [Prevotella sp.]|nr:hypothetical protein [Prevotella sp.]